MTPKQKAKELFDKYFDLYPDQDAYFLAQLAAIIAIEEIIDHLKFSSHTDIIFWSEVKNEIEKII